MKTFVLFFVSMWLAFFANEITAWDIRQYGLTPRTIDGLFGILSISFLHGNLQHLWGNSIGLFWLIGIMAIFYNKVAATKIIAIALLSGIMLWAFGRNGNHIGASMLLYGVAFFLMTAGWVEGKIHLMILSLVVILWQFGRLWGGIFEAPAGVSWEGHLFGAIAGIIVGWNHESSQKYKITA